MSVNLQAAFNMALSMQSRSVELYDSRTDTTYNVKIAPSNYFRNFAAVDDMAIEGREFVISQSVVSELSITIRRGWKIIDPELGGFTISEVREMVGLGNIIGYRLRTN